MEKTDGPGRSIIRHMNVTADVIEPVADFPITSMLKRFGFIKELLIFRIATELCADRLILSGAHFDAISLRTR